MPVDLAGKRRWLTRDEKRELCQLFDDYPNDDAGALAERFNEIYKVRIDPIHVARTLRDFGRSTRGRGRRTNARANGTAKRAEAVPVTEQDPLPCPAPAPASDPLVCSTVSVSPVPDAPAAATTKQPTAPAHPAGVFREKPDRAIDRELRAMEAIHDHFVGLADEQIRRVLCWATMKYRLIGMSQHFSDQEQP